MRVNICGLTDMTISFTGIGLILRGKTKATNIDIKNDDQMRELIGMKNAKLISLEMEEVAPVIIKAPEAIKIVLEDLDKEEETGIEEEEIEDIGDAVNNDSSISIAPLIPEIPKMPKFPKLENSKKLENDAQNKKNSKKTIKRIAKQENLESTKTTINDQDEGEVVIMTTAGAKKGRGKRTMSGEMPESEATRASIEALKKLEDEEKEGIEEEANRKPIDESKLPLEERMGGKATIAFGTKNIEAVKMKNSILPEADQIRNANLIPLEEKSFKQKEKERIKSAFIDSSQDDDEDAANPDDNEIEH